MTWLFEQPLPIVVMGVITVLALAAGFVKTGRRSLLAALAAVVATVVGLLLLEQAMVTDRERVEATLHEIADAVERNDIGEALSHVSPQAPGYQRAKTELPQIRFQEVTIKPNLEIEVFPDRTPPEADARFNVMVVADVGLGGAERYPRYVEVNLVKEGDRWIVRNYNHFEPTRGMRINPR